MRKTKFQKAKEVVELEQVFRVTTAKNIDIWAVKGLNNTLYDVVFKREEKTFSCTCKNVLKTDCYHIIAVKIMMRGGTDGLKDI